MKRLLFASLVVAALGGCASAPDRYYSRVDDRVYYSYNSPERYHDYYSFNDRFDLLYGYQNREHGS